MVLVANKVQENLISRGLGDSVDPTTGSGPCETIEINLEAIVTTEEDFYPLTGEYAGIKGWVWNKTIPQNYNSRYERIENSTGGYSYNLEEGSIETDWQGSILTGMELSSVKTHLVGATRETWVPEIEKGSYSIFNFESALLGSGQLSKILETDSIVLEEDLLENSVKITLFKRDNLYNNIPFYRYVNTDLGLENLSFKTDNNIITVNEVKTIFVGSERIDKDTIECHYENKGFGNDAREIIYSKYFPITNVKVVTVDNRGNVEVFTEVETFRGEEAASKIYKVDKECGRVIFPRKVTDKVFYLKKDLGDTLEFFEPLKDFPEEGKLVFNGTEFLYKAKSKYKVFLEDVERAASLDEGASLKLAQEGSFLEEKTIYLSYLATPRVDYEVKETTFSSNINLKPYSTITSNGILQLGVDEKNLKKIQLYSDKRRIVDNIFGEIFFGTDSSRLTAELTNGNGRPVEDIAVEFYTVEGTFGNGAKKEIDVSNLEGKAFTFYKHDYEEATIGTILNPRQINLNSYFEIDDLSPGLTIDDITLFQVLKVDPFKGSLGYKVNIDSFSIEDEELLLTISDDYILENEEYNSMYEPKYGLGNVVNEDLCLNFQYNYGLAILYFDNGRVSVKTTINYIEENKISLNAVNLLTEYSLYGSPSAIRIFKRGELEFSLEEAVTTNKTFDRLIYNYDFNEEVYKKLKPTHIEGNRVYYDRVLPLGGRSENNILAGYKLFYPKLVDVYAEAVNPATGQRLRSNLIKLKVALPPYLSSDDGFKFLEEDNEEGSGLGGTNFLSINPEINNRLNVLLF